VIDALSVDHVQFSVPDIARVRALHLPFPVGSFTAVHGGPELDACSAWNTNGGDFI